MDMFFFSVANFSYEWEVSNLTNVRTKYKAGESRDIHADIGVHIGLRGVNITLEGRFLSSDKKTQLKGITKSFRCLNTVF